MYTLLVDNVAKQANTVVTMSIQRWWINVESTLFQRGVSAGRLLTLNKRASVFVLLSKSKHQNIMADEMTSRNHICICFGVKCWQVQIALSSDV